MEREGVWVGRTQGKYLGLTRFGAVMAGAWKKRDFVSVYDMGGILVSHVLENLWWV